MQVGDPTILTPVVTPASPPAVQPIPARPTDGRPAARDRRDALRDGRRTEFRAALDAAAAGSSTQTLAQPLAAESRVTAQETRPEKRPTGDLELSGDETADFLSAAHSAPSPETADVQSRQFRAVTQQYVQRYFSVGQTFAARGDSLEITA